MVRDFLTIYLSNNKHLISLIYTKAFNALIIIPNTTKPNIEDSIKSLKINSLLQNPAKGGIPAKENSIKLNSRASN